jgi:hypothetical protein
VTVQRHKPCARLSLKLTLGGKGVILRLVTTRKQKRRPTLQHLAARHVGRIGGAKVVAFIVQWAIAGEALGRSLTLDDYADWWHASRSTVFREQARFREAFPGEATPQRLVDLLKQDEGETWFKRGVSSCARTALKGDAIIEALSRGSGTTIERTA